MELKLTKKPTMATTKKNAKNKEKLKKTKEKKLKNLKEPKDNKNLVKNKKEKKLKSVKNSLQDLNLRVEEEEEDDDVSQFSDFSEEIKQDISGSQTSDDESQGGHLSDGIAGDGERNDANVSGGGGGGDGDDDDGDSYHSVEESDSSEDEVPDRNTVGDVPRKFYEDEEIIGYDITGKKIKKKERKDQLDRLLDNADNKKAWRRITDEYNDEEVELTKDELRMIRRILKGQTPHTDVDPHPDYIDWFDFDGKGHPLSNAPEPKRRFIPSKSERKKIIKYVRAIREGRITFDKPKEEPRFYLLWGDDFSSSEKRRGLSYIPPPKAKLPGHEESYNPSLEYIPTEEEISAYQLLPEEDRPNFIPKRFTSLRGVPAFDNLKENFLRCLDLYLCPRVRKKRLNIDPESLKPKLPNQKDLKPYPTTCYIEYKGHNGAVVSLTTEASGQWIASGSTDGTVRIWEVATGRCIRTWEIGSAIRHVAWNPVPHLPILAVVVDQDVLILDTGTGSEEEQGEVRDLLHFEKPSNSDDSGFASYASWLPDDKFGGLRLRHFKTVSSIEWHYKGDYFSTVIPAGESRSIMIHKLSKKGSQKIPFKLHGIPVSTAFHPSRSICFISTKKEVRVYDLKNGKMIKKLDTRLREVSCIAVHPGGDNMIVGSREGKLCWFDMDLSSTPYKLLKNHTKDITNVAFHRKYPLFASCSEDNRAYVFHGMVYSDLNQNPLIVPLQVLRGHSSPLGRGVLDCKFHPKQPWLFTAGADSVIKLYCH